MRPPFYQPTIARIGVRPDQPDAVVGPRKRGSASVDPGKLGEALELLKMAKLAARSKRRRSAAEVAAGASLQMWEAPPLTVMRSLRSAGVTPERAPEALQDFIDSRAPPPEKRRRRRGRRDSGSAYHAWMREKE